MQTGTSQSIAKICLMRKKFFASFGINPLCCKISSSGVSKKNEFPCAGHYFVCGEYLEYPKENIITVNELADNDFIDERPNQTINIGIFKFIFQHPEYVFKNIPEDMPEGFICIDF